MEQNWPPPFNTANDYPLWTRALVGEMLPDVVTPLSWSMVWEPCAVLGWRDAMVRRMGFDEDEFNAEMPETIGLIGGYGYLNEFPLERLARDTRVHQILEGTNEIMRVIVSRRVLQEDAGDAIR